MKVNFTAPSEFEVFLEPPSITVAPVKYSLSQNDFVTPPIPTKGKKIAKIPPAPYLIIGFDTEFQTSAQNYTHQEMIAGKVKNTILSYQFHAIYSGNTSSCWQGIACPPEEVIDDRITEKRLSLGEFISFAIAEGVRQGRIDKCPLRIYLVGHFTRADTIILILSSIWNSETVIPSNIIMAPLLTLAPLHSSNEPNWVLRDIPRLQ